MKDFKEILLRNGFRFNKMFGQNFISDTNLLKAIVGDSGITAEDTVVEIGAGAGTLTRQLASSAKKVVCFEIDRNLQPVLAEMLEDCKNVTVCLEDALKAELSRIDELAGGPYKVVANLPYYITTPLIMKFLEGETAVTSLTVMVQKEVAERFTAKPATPEYGAVTLAIAARGDAKLVRTVNRRLFYPVPNVDSAIVRIDLMEKYPGEDLGLYRKVCQAAFSMRRKTLANNLMAAFRLTREQAEHALVGAGISERERGENLDAAAYFRLMRTLKIYLETQ